MNLLAVELKPGVPRRAAAVATNKPTVDRRDGEKLRHLTSHKWMEGQSPYALGVCLQLAHDRARLHWYEHGAHTGHEDWMPPAR